MLNGGDREFNTGCVVYGAHLRGDVWEFRSPTLLEPIPQSCEDRVALVGLRSWRPTVNVWLARNISRTEYTLVVQIESTDSVTFRAFFPLVIAIRNHEIGQERNGSNETRVIHLFVWQ